MSSTWLTVTPAAKARLPAACTIGPSAIGSVNGTPISIKSAPASGNPRSRAIDVSPSGSQASMNGINAPRPSNFSAANRAAMRLISSPSPRGLGPRSGPREGGGGVPPLAPRSQPYPQMLRHRENVLIPPPAQIHQDDLILPHRRREFCHMRQCVRRLQCRNDPLGPRAQLKRRQRLFVGRRHILNASDVMQPRMLRPDARIIQSGADRVRLDDLPVIILQQIRAVAVQHTRPPASQTRRMLAAFDAVPARLHANQPHR